MYALLQRGQFYFMAEGKKSFIAYSDWDGMFQALPDEVAGKLTKHIFSYVNDRNPESNDYTIVALFEQIKTTLKRDLAKWEQQREQRSEAGKTSAKNRSTKINERSIPLNENVRNPTVSVSVNVNDIVNDNVNDNVNEEKEEERTHETFDTTVIFTSPEIENKDQRKVAPKESENEIVVYPIEEIKTRLSEWEYELIENSCKVLKITVEEYKAGVDLFLYQQGDEGMKKDYTDVKKHFRSWLKNNITNIRKSLNTNGKPPEKGNLQKMVEASEGAKRIVNEYFENKKRNENL
jgi:hypothetical protein